MSLKILYFNIESKQVLNLLYALFWWSLAFRNNFISLLLYLVVPSHIYLLFLQILCCILPIAISKCFAGIWCSSINEFNNMRGQLMHLMKATVFGVLWMGHSKDFVGQIRSRSSSIQDTKNSMDISIKLWSVQIE